MQNLITDHLDIWTAAHKTRSTAGRGSNNKLNLHGIKKLRELILELAVRGKLVLQDSNDEPASELLKRIAEEKAKLIKEEKIKKEKLMPEITDEEKPFELPRNWIWTRLGRIFSLENGDRSKNYPNKSFLVDSGIPFVNAGHLVAGKIDKNEMTFITQDHFNLLRGGKFYDGDILYCLRGSLGKSAIVEGFETGAIASSLVILRPASDANKRFFCAYFDSPLSYRMISKYDNGTAQPNLSAADLEKFCVPLPPLAEQNRIVAKVDELMIFCDQLEKTQSDNIAAHAQLVEALLATLTNSSGHNELQNNWQRIAVHFDTLFTTEHSIDQLKQTILQLAVMGKLVPQDPNGEPAGELLKKIAAEKAKLIKEGKIKKEKPLPEITDEEKPFELPRGWEWCRLSQITSVRGGSTPSMARSEFWGGNILWVSPKDMHDGTITDSELKITDQALKETSLELVPIGSILIVGRSGILKRKLPAQITGIPCTVNQDIKAVTPINPLMDRYLQLIFLGNEREILMRDVKQGTTVQSLVYENLFSRPFSLPPLEEQHRIVAKVDELMTLCDTLKTHLQNAQTTQLALADALVEQVVL